MTIFLTCSLSESDPLLLDFVADSSSSSSLVLVYLQFKPNLFPPKFQVSLPLNLRDPTRTGCRLRSLILDIQCFLAPCCIFTIIVATKCEEIFFPLLWRSGGMAAAPLTGGGLCVSSLKSTTLNPSCLLLNGLQGLCCQATLAAVVVGGGVVDSVSSRMDTRRKTLPDSGTRIASVIAGWNAW